LTPYTLLICLLAVLALLALTPIVLPLLRSSAPPPAGSAATLPVEEGASLWRDQRAELDDSLDLGVIDQAEHQALAAALTQAAKSDLDGSISLPKSTRLQSSGRRIWLAVLLAVVVAAIAIPLYAKLGTPDVSAELAAQNQPNQEGGTPPAADPQVAAMVATLAQRMQEHPDDPKGWNLLGRSYMVLRDYPDSVKAYRHAALLLPNDANVLADLADATAMQNGGRLTGEPTSLIVKALAIDSKNLKVLELAGSAALQRGDPRAARDYWVQLRAQLPNDSDDAHQVDGALAQLVQALGQGAGVAAMPGGAAVANSGAPSALNAAPGAGANPADLQAPPGAAAGNSAASATNSAAASSTPPVLADQIRAAQSAAAEGPTISGSVDISPAMAAQVSLTDVVYLSARAAGPAGKGPSIPLAVMRLEARQLPASFTLDDGMSMDSSHKLSDATQVVIEAHIAKHGTPITTAGDLAAKAITAKLGATGVNLVIDHVVP
jgi:cytochrome c-type biogenesis protein CcmH